MDAATGATSQQDEKMVDLQMAINQALAENNEAVIDEEERLMTSAYYGQRVQFKEEWLKQ